MKLAVLLVVITLQSSFAMKLSAQQSDEALIRSLEEKERTAILRNDTSQLSQLMSHKIVVQNPENAIVGYRQIINRMMAGKINYATFERKIEHISIINGTAVVMGQETIMPEGSTLHAGKTVERRFTNIWTKENDTWKLTARQATITSIY